MRFGERWRSRIDAGLPLNALDMAMPAVSDTTVAITYVQPDESAGSRGRRPMLLLLDRATGRRAEPVPLPLELFATTAGMQLEGLGDGLFACGARLMQWMR